MGILGIVRWEGGGLWVGIRTRGTSGYMDMESTGDQDNILVVWFFGFFCFAFLFCFQRVRVAAVRGGGGE